MGMLSDWYWHLEANVEVSKYCVGAIQVDVRRAGSHRLCVFVAVAQNDICICGVDASELLQAFELVRRKVWILLAPIRQHCSTGTSFGFFRLGS